MTSPLKLQIEHGLATMTFSAPERANVLDLAMARAFASAVQTIASDASVRAVLITGEGKQFCAGGDIAFLRNSALTDEGAGGRKFFFDEYRLNYQYSGSLEFFRWLVCILQPTCNR
jgi:enoyl-CoA hydratase